MKYARVDHWWPRRLPVLEPTGRERHDLAFWLAVGVFVAVLATMLGNALLPFIGGFAIAFFLAPVVDRLERLGMKRSLAAALAIFGFVCFGIGILALVIPPLWDQTVRLAAALPQMIGQAAEFVQRIAERVLRESAWSPGAVPSVQPRVVVTAPGSGDQLQSLAPLATQALASALDGGVAVLQAAFLLLLTPMIAFFLLRDWTRLIATIDGWIPLRCAPIVREQAREMQDVMAGFLRGQLVSCFVMAFYFGIALTLAGLDFGLVIGIVTGFLTFVPLLGTLTGLALALGAALLQAGGDAALLLAVAAVFAGAEVLMNVILQPVLIGGRVRLHPVWLVFGIIVSEVLFGLIGILIAVPLFAMIGVLARFSIDCYLRSAYFDHRLAAPAPTSSPDAEAAATVTIAPPLPAPRPPGDAAPRSAA